MGPNSSLDHRPNCASRYDDSAWRKCGALVLKVVRYRLAAYITISFAIALAFHFVESRHRENLQQAIWHNCQQQEDIKKQANERILILKEAQQAVIFRTGKDRERLSKLIEGVHPLPAYDCSHLRPGK